MIKHTDPLSMTESFEYIKNEKETDAEMQKFIKKFVKLKPEKAREIREKITALSLLKVKPEHIAKIIDTMPEDQESLNKIFTDISLDEDETKQILETLQRTK